MGVIRHEYPCIALGLGFRQENRKPFNKVFTIFIIIKYPAALYSPYHDMMQEAGAIESGCPGHNHKLLLQLHAVKLFDYLRTSPFTFTFTEMLQMRLKRLPA